MKRTLKVLIAVLVVALALCAFAVSALAAASEGNEARIGTEYYETLTGAIAAANDGDRITLLSDVTVTEPLSFTKSLTLDLSGNRITGSANKYMFSLDANNIDVKIVGEGTIFAYANVSTTQEGMVRIPDASKDSKISIIGSFDGITLLGEGGAYLAHTAGTVTLENLTVYSPKKTVDDEIYGIFNSRENAATNLNRVVLHKTVSPTDSSVSTAFSSAFSIYDGSTVVITDSYIHSPARGITIRHDSSTTISATHKYLTVSNSVINATHARPDELWQSVKTGGVQTGWKINSGKGYAIVMNLHQEVQGVCEFDGCELLAAWRTITYDGVIVSPENSKNTVNIKNSTVKSYNALCGITLTKKMVEDRIKADGYTVGTANGNYKYDTSSKKYVVVGDVTGQYTYDGVVDSPIIPNEPLFVRGTGTIFNFSSTKFLSGSQDMFWTGAADDVAHGKDYFFLDAKCRFNRVPKYTTTFTVVGFGDQTKVDVGPFSRVTGDEYAYCIVGSSSELEKSGDGYYSQIKYKLQDSAGATSDKGDGVTETTLAPIQQSFVSGGCHGNYMKWTVSRPTAANNPYYSSGGAGYVDENTIKLGQDPYIVFRGKNVAGSTVKTQIYDKTTLNKLYDYLTYDISFKTDSTFMTYNTNISSRNEDINGSLSTNYNVLYFYEASDGKVYLRTEDQKAAGNTGYPLPTKGVGEWYHLTVVIELADNTGAVDRTAAHHSKAYFYLDGVKIAEQAGVLMSGTGYFDGARFNTNASSQLDLGETICFDDYSVRTYNKADIAASDAIGYIAGLPYEAETKDDVSSMGAYAGYVVAPTGEKLYGDYYANVAAALSASSGKYFTLDLLKNESGTNITSSVRIKEAGGKLSGYTAASSLGIIKGDGVYTFSDAYTSVVTRSYTKTVLEADYSVKNEKIELPIGQPIPNSPTYSTEISSNVTGNDNYYKATGWTTTVGGKSDITLVPEVDVTVYEVYSANLFIIYNASGGFVKRSFMEEDFITEMNSLPSGYALKLRNDITYRGDGQISIVGKTVNLDLGGFDLIVVRTSDGEAVKHLFRFENTTEGNKSIFNVSSSVAGGDIYTTVENTTKSGAIFYVADYAVGNTVNVLGTNVTLSSSCILDARGTSTAFKAEGGRFLRINTDYSGMFVVRPGAQNVTVSIENAEIGSFYITSVFNLLNSTAVANVKNSSFASLNDNFGGYIAYVGGGTTTVTAQDGSTSTVDNPTFSGTVNITDCKLDFIPASSAIETDTAVSGKINLIGNVYMTAAKQFIKSTVSGTPDTVNYTYFVNESHVTYNGASFSGAEFVRVGGKLTLGGSSEVSYLAIMDDGSFGYKTVELSKDLEVAIAAGDSTFVKWVKYSDVEYSPVLTADVESGAIETSPDAPFSLDAGKSGVYAFAWKKTGAVTPDALSVSAPLYAITTVGAVECKMISVNDFKLASNLSLSDNFDYNVYIPTTLVDNGGDIVYTLAGEAYTLDTSDVASYGSKNYYVITYSDISAASAADTFSLKLEIPIDGRTEKHTTNFTFSVVKYARTVIDGTYSDLTKQMITDMLGYIKAFYGYNGSSQPQDLTGALSAASAKGFSESSFSLATEAKTPVGVGSYISGATVNASASSLKLRFILANGVTAKIKLSYVSSVSGAKSVVITATDGAITEVNGNTVTDGKNYYDLDMKVYDFNEDVTIAIDADNDGSFGTSLDVSGVYNSASYVNFAGSTSAGNLVKALYTYAKSAKAYQASL